MTDATVLCGRIHAASSLTTAHLLPCTRAGGNVQCTARMACTLHSGSPVPCAQSSSALTYSRHQLPLCRPLPCQR